VKNIVAFTCEQDSAMRERNTSGLQGLAYTDEGGANCPFRFFHPARKTNALNSGDRSRRYP